MPTAAGAIRSSPGPGSGSGRSTSSRRSPPWNSIALTGVSAPERGVRDVEHLAGAHELDPRAALRRAQRALVLVDRPPPLPRAQVRAALGQPLRAGVGAGVGRRVEQAGVAVLEDAGHGVGGVLLVGPDHARRAALDPADDVLAGGLGAVVADHPAAVVADHAAALVERDPGQRQAAIADRAQHEPAGDDLLLVGGDGAQAAARVGLDAVAHHAHAGHRAVLALAEDLHRRAQEAQLDLALVPVRLASRVLAQQLDVAPRGAVGLVRGEPGRARRVELHVLRVDYDVRARELAQLAQL